MNKKEYRNMTIDERIYVHKHRRKLAKGYIKKAKDKFISTLDSAPKRINNIPKTMETIKIWD